MRITTEQVKALLNERRKGGQLAHNEVNTERLGDADLKLLHEVKQAILAMPEVRQELVHEIRERIERGEYNPSADEIVDAMIRRAIADRAGN